ncbi:ABC transporter ATP-binding protein [Wukongibacter sp. M2B1]|uniref:ABC transporter ATP-binding protein n=1 Tax=Wukongibacter sp. M2B1 TaxID=3088895 RepID=UPI003D7A429B
MVNSKNTKESVLKRFMLFVKPYSGWLFLCSMAAIGNVALDIFVAYLIKNLVSTTLANMYRELTSIVYIMILTIIGGIIVKFIKRHSAGRVCTYIIRDIRSHVSKHLENIKAFYIDSNHSGDITSRMTNSILALQKFLELDLSDFIYQPLILIATLIYMAFINWKILLINILLLFVISFIAMLLSKPIGQYTEEMQLHLGRVNSVVQDTIDGMHMVKALNLYNILDEKFSYEVSNVLDKGLKLEKRNSVVLAIQMNMLILPIGLCTMYGGYLAFKGDMNPGSLITFVFLMNFLSTPAYRIPQMIAGLKSVTGAASYLFEVLDWERERKGGCSLSSFDRSIEEKEIFPVELSNVSFSYDGKATILDGLSFRLEKGKTMALVGTSGSGKSTILKLICGFYELGEGYISLFDNDLNKWDLEKARSQISIVAQDTYLFPTTIAENIAYGKKGASFNEIVEAAMVANAHEFIIELPEGYNTQVGEQGLRLSGGQRQRIAIARAVLKDAPILLLDEPTASLDKQSELLIQNALEKITDGKTVLVIAHRLSTIKNADEIMVLNQGHIVERGIHKALMGKDGFYRQLYTKQFSNNDSTISDVNREVSEVC